MKRLTPSNKKGSMVVPVAVMLVILAVLIMFMCLPVGQTDGNAAGGAVDLRAADLSGSVYQLTGEWQYTPGQLYEPETFPADAPYISLPKNMSEGDEYLNTCATYRLTVYTDDTRLLNLYIPEIYTAYELWVNGEYVRGSGVVADNPAESQPSFESVLVPVKAADGKIEIVIQASDYHWMRPHMNNVLKLGESDSMYSWFFRTRTLYLLAMGFILAAAFYHFALYIMRRKMTVYLSFSLLCFFCFWRLALETEGISDLTGWFATVSGVLDGRIYLVMFFMHGAFAGMFSLYVFSREFVTKYIHSAVGYCALGVVVLSFIPTNVAWFALVFAVLTLLPLVLALYMALRSQALRENKTLWLYIVAIILYITVEAVTKYFADHLLYMTPVITSIYMVMAQSLILAKEYADTTAKEQLLATENTALESANRLKADIMATVSHETRTPIAVISSYTELIAMELRAQGVSEQHAKDLDAVSDEIQHIGLLMTEMENLSRSRDNDAGKSGISLADVIEQTARLYSHILERQNTSLIVELSETLPPVYANPGEVTQVLLNILQNAGKHTQNGKVTITAQVMTDKSKIEVSIADTGAGITRSLLPRVFERGVSGEENGTGIGLAVCREIVRAHGGEITIESELGAGTTVRFTLPVDKGGNQYD